MSKPTPQSSSDASDRSKQRFYSGSPTELVGRFRLFQPRLWISRSGSPLPPQRRFGREQQVCAGRSDGEAEGA